MLKFVFAKKLRQNNKFKMGIKRFFKNKIKDYHFIKNRRKVTANLQNLDFLKIIHLIFLQKSILKFQLLFMTLMI
ncbi:hypothetical protein EB354_22000 [Chryseobacterium balustinum]|nr:hypothetical protein EB354_22000 [Chryseobacterium balustinum]